MNIPILRATRALDSAADVFKKKLEAFQGFAFWLIIVLYYYETLLYTDTVLYIYMFKLVTHVLTCSLPGMFAVVLFHLIFRYFWSLPSSMKTIKGEGLNFIRSILLKRKNSQCTQIFWVEVDYVLENPYEIFNNCTRTSHHTQWNVESPLILGLKDIYLHYICVWCKQQSLFQTS